MCFSDHRYNKQAFYVAMVSEYLPKVTNAKSLPENDGCCVIVINRIYQQNRSPGHLG